MAEAPLTVLAVPRGELWIRHDNGDVVAVRPGDLAAMRYGIQQARRGGLTKAEVAPRPRSIT